ncbi:RHS repeat-associated core domain-containing protein, partial [Serratia fonticola]
TSKTVEGQTTEYLWQGNKLIAETDNQQHWQTFLYEPGSHRPMATIVGSSRVNSPKVRTYWYQNDHLGTPHSLTDSQGNTVWRGQYSAYGQLTEEWTPPDARDEHPQPKVSNPLRFQGQYEDAESGLYYNLNRYYDPELGRYLTADPVKLDGGLNFYQYVDGNPVSWVDPLGLFKQDGTGFDNAVIKTDTPALPKIPSSSMDDLLATGKLPGNSGTIITDRSVSYSDLFKLSTNNSTGFPKEVLLVRQEIDGKMRHVIYSGDAGRVRLPPGSRPVAHTHPTENIHQKWPSSGDMNTLNKYYDTQLLLNPKHNAQPHAIIWGKKPGDTTIVYPGPGKNPLPPKNPNKR